MRFSVPHVFAPRQTETLRQKRARPLRHFSMHLAQGMKPTGALCHFAQQAPALPSSSTKGRGSVCRARAGALRSKGSRVREPHEGFRDDAPEREATAQAIQPRRWVPASPAPLPPCPRSGLGPSSVPPRKRLQPPSPGTATMCAEAPVTQLMQGHRRGQAASGRGALAGVTAGGRSSSRRERPAASSRCRTRSEEALSSHSSWAWKGDAVHRCEGSTRPRRRERRTVCRAPPGSRAIGPGGNAGVGAKRIDSAFAAPPRRRVVSTSLEPTMNPTIGLPKEGAELESTREQTPKSTDAWGGLTRDCLGSCNPWSASEGRSRS